MPPAVNNNNLAVQAEKKAERLRGSLKVFILKEKKKAKEEFEAKVEEERLRKEREARERQNDMTLEETRGQITKLDQKLTDLRNQKQQLFLQLKKVLNEDENRKKQQKDNEMFALQALQAQQACVPPQQFLPPVRVQHHQMPILPKPIGNQPAKRGRIDDDSDVVPLHQGYYKPYTQQKHDDGRRGADYARVLWNKPPTQYQNPGTLFYQTTSNVPPPNLPDTRNAAIIYPAYNLPLRGGYPPLELQQSNVPSVSKTETMPTLKSAQVFHINLDQPPQPNNVGSVGIQSQKPQVTMEKIADRYHVELKHEVSSGHGPPHQLPEGVVPYTPLMPGMQLHPSIMQLGGNPNQNPKSGVSFVPGRGGASTHEQLSRQQQQMSVLQAQSNQQQQMHYSRRFL